jgi:hypothetical protein
LRQCFRCGVEITACMGCVLARDLEAFYEGKNPLKIFREHCGRCSLWIELHPEYLYLITGQPWDNTYKKKGKT